MRRLIFSIAACLLGANYALAQVAYLPHLPTTLEFTGGPIATFGTITAGSGYVPGTYTNVPLTGGTGSGALANIVVNGDGTVHSGGVTLGSTGGAAITQTGATGYLVGDSLSALNTNLGGTGSGFAVAVATVSSYQFLVPNGVSWFLIDACGAGGSGSGGQTTTGGGGGGGGTGPTVISFSLAVIPQSTISLTPGQPVAGGAIGSAGSNGGATQITGALDTFQQLLGGGGAAAPVTTTGATGGNGTGSFSASGAIHGANATNATPHYNFLPGSGGGGGASTGDANSGSGSSQGPFSSGTNASGASAGGGGGGSWFGQGGNGSNSGAGGPASGFCAGGGGGFQNFPGGASSPGLIKVHY